MRHPVRALVFGALAVGLLATGCNKTSEGGGGPKDSGKAAPIVVDYKGTVKGPAKQVPGAKTGGKITILQDGDFEYLDPQQEYVSNALEYGQLFHRMLTNYIEDPNGGTLQLVGDLATNAGETTDGGKTWTYHLRDNVKFEDGSAITSKDVAYGVARAFSDQGVQGPQYLQDALDPTRAYKGPYGGQLLPPGVTTPDDKTITFTFASAHAELPYLLAFPTSTPVPAAKDTKDKYSKAFVSSGPYKLKEYKADVSMTVEKNTNWDPSSDPIRNQYADSVVFDFQSDATNQTQRLKAAAGDDAAGLMTSNVAPEEIAAVKADPELMKRVSQGPSPFVSYIYINTTRITDVDVRRALNYAFDRDAYIKVVGGYDVATPATTLLAPIVPGYKKFDIYAAPNNGVNGDVDKARSLLSGKTVPKLKYCFSNTPTNQKVSAVNQTAWARAGIQTVFNPIDSAAYYRTVGVKGTDCDLIAGGWGQDYPDGDSTLGVLFDGSKIVDRGNNNLAYFNDPGIVAKMKELRENADRSKVASSYGDLDEQIMRDFAPAVPLRYLRNFLIQGPNVGGTFVSPLYAQFNVCGMFVK